MTAEVSQLANGLTVATVPGTTSMAAVVYVQAGSRQETREVAGTAHFLEHLFFKGTPKRPTTLDIATEMDAYGFRFNAFTSKENTAYFVKGAAEYAEPGVEILADMLGSALLLEEEIDRERGVIAQEMQMYKDQAGAWASRMAGRLLYGDTPMGWDVVGFPEVIGSVTRDQIAAYRANFYSPERMTLAIGGPVEHAKARELAERYLSSLEARATPGFLPAVLTDDRSAYEKRDYLSQSTILLLFPGPSHQDPEKDVMALQLGGMLLGGSMSSRLFIAVRERQGLAYSIGAGLSVNSDTGTVTVSTAVDPANGARAVNSILAEVERLVADGVTEDEVLKARAMYKSSYVLQREDAMQLAMSAAAGLHYRGRVREQAETFALVDSIEAADIQAQAQRYLQTAQLRTVVVGPTPLAD